MGAHPYMQHWYRQIKALWPTTHISWAYRGKDDQEQAFTDHRSKLHFPFSPHNRTDLTGKPESIALDLFELIDHQAVFNPIFYAKVADYSAKEHMPILWGHSFKSLGDDDHFQYVPPLAGATLMVA